MNLLAANQALPEGALAVANTEDVLALAQSLPAAPAVVLNFPKWTDGRAYSQAVLLRGRLRYSGPIWASGDVVADMAPLLRRCGFTGAQLREGQALSTAQRALGFFGEHYQSTLSERHAGHAAANKKLEAA